MVRHTVCPLWPSIYTVMSVCDVKRAQNLKLESAILLIIYLFFFFFFFEALSTCIDFLEFDLHPRVSFCEGPIAVQGAEIYPQISICLSTLPSIYLAARQYLTYFAFWEI